MRHPQAQTPDDAARLFTAFFNRMQNPMLALLARTAVGADQEALLEDAFEVAWRHLLETGRLDRAWFVQVVRNKVGDFYRAAARREQPVDALAFPDPSQLRDPTDGWGEHVDVRRAMRRLPVDKFEVLVLRFWCDLSNAEAASILGISATAFGTRLSRAKHAFRAECLREHASVNGEVVPEEVLSWIAQSD